MTTNLYFSDTDLYYIFSGDVGGGILGDNLGYTDDDSADNVANLGKYVDNTVGIQPQKNVGYTTKDGEDFSSILNPWYKDQIVSPSDSSSSTQYGPISIPTWASRVAILIQAGGGAGVSSYTQDYYTYSQLTYTGYSQLSYVYYNFYNYMKHNSCWNTYYTKCYYKLTAYGQSNGYTWYGTQTNESSKTMSGATGGGGGCIAAVFDVNNDDISENSTLTITTDSSSTTISDEPSYYNNISVSIGSSYYMTANGGSSAVTPSSSYINSYQSGTLLTSTGGNGGVQKTTSYSLPTSATTIYYSNGSNGSVGGSTGGQSGYYNNNTISSNFLPSINSSDYGTGTANTTGTDGIVRYWFIV